MKDKMNIEKAKKICKQLLENRLPKYTETTVDGKVYRSEILELEPKLSETKCQAIEVLLVDREQLIKENYNNKNKSEIEITRLALELENSISKDTIKAKIEELKNDLKKYEEQYKENQDEDYYFDINAMQKAINVLEELLK